MKSQIQANGFYADNSPVDLLPPLLLVTYDIDDLSIELILPLFECSHINDDIPTSLDPDLRPKARWKLDEQRWFA